MQRDRKSGENKMDEIKQESGKSERNVVLVESKLLRESIVLFIFIIDHTVGQELRFGIFIIRTSLRPP